MINDVWFPTSSRKRPSKCDKHAQTSGLDDLSTLVRGGKWREIQSAGGDLTPVPAAVVEEVPARRRPSRRWTGTEVRLTAEDLRTRRRSRAAPRPARRRAGVEATWARSRATTRSSRRRAGSQGHLSRGAAPLHRRPGSRAGQPAGQSRRTAGRAVGRASRRPLGPPEWRAAPAPNRPDAAGQWGTSAESYATTQSACCRVSHRAAQADGVTPARSTLAPSPPARASRRTAAANPGAGTASPAELR